MRKIYLFIYLVYLEALRIFFKKKYHAAFNLTDNCNLRCEHCYHFKDSHNHSGKDESVDTWEKRFDDLYKNGIRFVLLAGGEPTLRMDIIELAYKKFPSVHIITNGQFKIPSKFKNLIIFLSLEGDKEKNDKIRGKDTFDKAIENYSGDSRVIITITLMMKNFLDLEKVVELSQKHFFRGVVCSIYSGGNNEEDLLVLNNEERLRIVDELRRVKKLYPEKFLLTKSMINWYSKPNHLGYCYWGDEVLHLDSHWEERRCFAGMKNCSDCGCFPGAVGRPSSLFFYPREAFKLI